jgi:hypothetical protein
MGTDADGVVGKIKGKAKEVFGESEGRGDADPDVEYEPTPDQHVMNDGMVVLSKSQAEDSGHDEAGSGSSGAGHDEAAGRGQD